MAQKIPRPSKKYRPHLKDRPPSSNIPKKLRFNPPENVPVKNTLAQGVRTLNYCKREANIISSHSLYFSVA